MTSTAHVESENKIRDDSVPDFKWHFLNSSPATSCLGYAGEGPLGVEVGRQQSWHVASPALLPLQADTCHCVVVGVWPAAACRTQGDQAELRVGMLLRECCSESVAQRMLPRGL